MKKCVFAIVLVALSASQSALACRSAGGGGGGGYMRCGGVESSSLLSFEELVDLAPIAVLDARDVLVRAEFANGTSSIYRMNEEELNQVPQRLAVRFRKAYQLMIDGPSI